MNQVLLESKAKKRGIAIALPVAVPLLWAIFYNDLEFGTDALAYGLFAAPILFGLYLLLPTLKDRVVMLWAGLLYLIFGTALSFYVLIVGVCSFHDRCF